MMQISQTGTRKINSIFKMQNRRFQNSIHVSRLTLHGLYGFTLIELIVVVFIISLSLALIMPSFWTTDNSAVKSEARHISSTLRFIYGEAVAKKQVYVLKFNFENKTWSYTSDRDSRSFTVKRNVEIKDIIIPSNGEISTGEIIIEFGPTGPQEPITLHLKKGDYEYTVLFNHLNGRSKILEGYVL